MKLVMAQPQLDRALAKGCCYLTAPNILEAEIDFLKRETKSFVPLIPKKD